MRHRSAARARTPFLLLLLLLPSWLLLSLTAAAHADGTLPNMSVTITPTTGYHKVCVHGDATGTVVAWQLTITGGGADGPIAPMFAPSVSANYDYCYFIWKYGVDFAYVVVLAGAPVGGTTPPFVSEGFGAYLDGNDYFVNSG